MLFISYNSLFSPYQQRSLQRSSTTVMTVIAIQPNFVTIILQIYFVVSFLVSRRWHLDNQLVPFLYVIFFHLVHSQCHSKRVNWTQIILERLPQFTVYIYISLLGLLVVNSLTMLYCIQLSMIDKFCLFALTHDICLSSSK